MAVLKIAQNTKGATFAAQIYLTYRIESSQKCEALLQLASATMNRFDTFADSCYLLSV